MNDKNTGGPAFPVIGGHAESFGPYGDKELTIGMTLRDYFAAKAMQAMISNSDLKNGPAVDGVSVTIEIAAYLVADAMIKEWNKWKQQKYLKWSWEKRKW